jgi:hypothetical protein
MLIVMTSCPYLGFSWCLSVPPIRFLEIDYHQFHILCNLSISTVTFISYAVGKEAAGGQLNYEKQVLHNMLKIEFKVILM